MSILGLIIAGALAAVGGISASIVNGVNGHFDREATAEANRQNWLHTLYQSQNEMAYNTAEAEKQRAWEERMSNTQIQRSMADYEAAGLNPLLAIPGGASYGTGSSASANLSVPKMQPVPSAGAAVAQGIGSLSQFIEKLGTMMLISKVTGMNMEASSARNFQNMKELANLNLANQKSLASYTDMLKKQGVDLTRIGKTGAGETLIRKLHL